MDKHGQASRRILLLSLVAMILPLVAFPARLGLDLARMSAINVLYELAYYGFVVFLFHRRTSLVKVIEAAGICLVYRLALGTSFGLLIAAMYAMDVRVSLSLGLAGYLPALLFQVAIAPFVLKPVIERFYAAKPAAAAQSSAVTPNSADTGRTSMAVSRERGPKTEEPVVTPVKVETVPNTAPAPAPVVEPPGAKTNQETTGFERAVAYIGEHGSVHLAAVVDDEGLLLGNFTRGQIDPEAWAPMALLFFQGSQDVLQRTDLDGLDKVDLQLNERRVVVARVEQGCLMVVSERQGDDLLNIRINQGLEMINRFVAERYGDKQNSNAERIHVSSAQ